jgi:tetratricopeptide (TPR) repeat protein
MEKISLPVKIIVFLICFIFIVLSFCCIAYMVKSQSPFAAVSWFLIFVLTFAVPAFFMTHFFTHWSARKTVGAIYWPGNNVELLPSDYSGIRSNIARGDYYKAIDDLNEMIEAEPENDIAIALLSDIYIDHLQKHGEAIKILSEFLNRPERTGKDIPFVMKLVDVLLEINEDEKAEKLLNSELAKKYNDKEFEILQKRLNGITLS